MKTQKIRIEIEGKRAKVRTASIRNGLYFYRYSTTGWQENGFYGSMEEEFALACIIAQQFDNNAGASLSGAMVGWAANVLGTWVNKVRGELSREQREFHENMVERIDAAVADIG